MNMRMNSKTVKLIYAAMAAALICAATMVVKIPSPLHGYINFGDGVILLSILFLPPGYAFLAAGIGSALADMLLGYVFYAPATFVIKGCMALAACIIYKRWADHKGFGMVVSGFVAEIIMILGYLLFEGAAYGFSASVVNVPANAVQGIAGILFATVMSKALKKTVIQSY